MWLNQDLPLATYFFSAIKKVGKKISAAVKMAKMNYPCSNRSELAQTKATRPSHCPRSLPQREPYSFSLRHFPKGGSFVS